MAVRVARALFCLVLVSCSESTGPNLSGTPGYLINSVRVAPSSATMLIPDSITTADRITFTATAFSKMDTPIADMRFAWSTSDSSIAMIDTGGTVTPVRPGTVDIIASAHKTGRARLEILPATQSVVISPLRDTIYVDDPIVASRDTVRLTATAYGTEAEQLKGIAFSWQSSAPTVLTVDANGVVHATGLGGANITVSAHGHSATTQITVLPIVARLEVTSPATQVLALDTLQLTAVARDYTDAPMARSVTWTSSNTAIATIAATGRVNFLTPGTVTFTARTSFRTSSTPVTALERRLTTLDAGEDFTCGFTALGRGYCWGRTDDGRTAAGADSSCFPLPTGCILPPKRMNNPDLEFTTLSAGGNFGCGLVTGGTIYCWGNDDFGQIGNGLDGAGETPSLATVRNERFTTIAAGGNHACALNTAGRAYCWGRDLEGQLGDHRLINSTTPIPVSDSTLLFRAISAGARHTCGITLAGAAYCWGDGRLGQLGTGLTGSSEVPVAVATVQSFTSISAGDEHTCAIDISGNVLCWGQNANGQLGIGVTGLPQLLPVAGPTGFSQVSAGARHTCGIAGGVVRCWGRSESGEIGDGIVVEHDVPTPTAVAGLQASLVTAGREHTCAISTIGEAWCWGSNRWGALGNEFQASVRATPQLVARPR